LAPILVQEIFAIIRKISKRGTTILLVEQNANMALDVSDYAYVLETGKISTEGPARELKQNDGVRRSYLGV
ncbi:ABC transporter ATP-binding protein, partial [Rhizobiaceae sp. 2RAB30]